MKELLESDNFYAKSGFLYLPLKLDSEIKTDLEHELKPESLIARFKSLDFLSRDEPETNELFLEKNGQTFVKGINILSLIETYESLEPRDYEKKRTSLLKKYSFNPETKVHIDSALETIVFEVMPYFIKTNKGLERKRIDKKGIIDLINEKEIIPQEYFSKAEKLYDLSSLRNKIEALEKDDLQLKLPKEEIISPNKFRTWFDKTLESFILSKEIDFLKSELDERSELAKNNKQYLATILYLKDKASLEIEGFGFYEQGDGYMVYKHTGPYALKDFDGKIYRFEDCKVGMKVADDHIYSPAVLNNYKHPFLEYSRSNQTICLGHAKIPREFSKKNLIKAFEIGLGVILQGYTNERNFGGYNRLDGRVHHGDARETFYEYKILRTDPQIISGELEITNDFIQ